MSATRLVTGMPRESAMMSAAIIHSTALTAEVKKLLRLASIRLLPMSFPAALFKKRIAM